MCFYVNQAKMENLHGEVAEHLSKKLSISFDAAEELISLFYVEAETWRQIDENMFERR